MTPLEAVSLAIQRSLSEMHGKPWKPEDVARAALTALRDCGVTEALITKAVELSFAHAQILATKHFGEKFGMLPERIPDAIKFVAGSDEAKAFRAMLDAALQEG